MVVVTALRSAVETLLREPVLFLAGLLVGLVALPQNAAQLAGIPLVPTALQVLTFFVTPFVVAGLLGMADEARSGDTSLGTLRRMGRERYTALLLGNLLEFALVTALTIALVIVLLLVVAVVVGGSALAGGFDPSAVSPAAAGIAFLVVALGLLAFLLVVFFVQFFSVAIVVEEAGPVDAFTRSYRVVRENLLATVGYSVVTVVVGVVTTAPLTGAVLWRTIGSLEALDAGAGAGAGSGMPVAPGAGLGAVGTVFSPVEVAALSAISLLLSTVLATFSKTYAVTFFRAVTSGARDGEEQNDGDDTVGALGPDDLDDPFDDRI